MNIINWILGFFNFRIMPAKHVCMVCGKRFSDDDDQGIISNSRQDGVMLIHKYCSGECCREWSDRIDKRDFSKYLKWFTHDGKLKQKIS